MKELDNNDASTNSIHLFMNRQMVTRQALADNPCYPVYWFLPGLYYVILTFFLDHYVRRFFCILLLLSALVINIMHWLSSSELSKAVHLGAAKDQLSGLNFQELTSSNESISKCSTFSSKHSALRVPTKTVRQGEAALG